MSSSPSPSRHSGPPNQSPFRFCSLPIFAGGRESLMRRPIRVFIPTTTRGSNRATISRSATRGRGLPQVATCLARNCPSCGQGREQASFREGRFICLIGRRGRPFTAVRGGRRATVSYGRLARGLKHGAILVPSGRTTGRCSQAVSRGGRGKTKKGGKGTAIMSSTGRETAARGRRRMFRPSPIKMRRPRGS